MSYVGRRPLSLAIRAYRRWLSGRGPLRRVSCTFAATESCSAYGLRAACEVATSLPHAVSLVRSRVRACRHASVYRFERGLGWERDHDRAPAELARSMVARGERPDTVAQVIAARMMIARWRGERDAYRGARDLDGRATAKHPIPVRAGDAAIAYHQGIARRAAVLALVAAALVAFSIFAVVPLALAAGAATSGRASAKRLERQRVAASFLRPRVAAEAA